MRDKFNRYIFYSIALLCITDITELCATIVSGEVSGQWTIEGHPYTVIDDIVLRAGQSLIIDAGIQVRFDSGTNFTVFGTLLANGSIRDSITFRANNGRIGDWRWLKFEGAGANRSVLNHCIIIHTDRGVHMLNSSPTISNTRISHHATVCVRFEGSQGRVLNSTISNSQRTGVSIEENSLPTVRNCSIMQHPYNGISLRDNSGGIISGNSIYSVGDYGITLTEAGVCSLAYNLIYNCGREGIYANQSDLPRIFRNVVTTCRGNYAIHLYRSESGDVINNTVISNSGTGLAVINGSANVINNVIISNGRDGIFVQNSNPNLSSNCVWNNTRGDYEGLEPGNSDIAEDPQLDQNYFPAEGSPVIDRGDQRYRDPDGTRADIGAKFFNQNHPPEIRSYWPEDPDTIQGDQEQEFGVEAVDPDNNVLVYTWYINGVQSGDRSVFTHTFTRDDEYLVLVLVDDRLFAGQITVEWSFSVRGSEVKEQEEGIVDNFRLSAPYPNPFNSSSQFSLTTNSTGIAIISLLDLQGREIAEFYRGYVQPGQRNFTILSQDIPAGTFIIRADFNGYRELKKLVVLK